MPPVHLRMRGLMTGPNQLEAPEGALLEAENVMIVRPGIIEPRLGREPYDFLPNTGGVEITPADYLIRGLIPIEGNYPTSGTAVLIYSESVGSPGTFRYDYLNGSAPITGLPKGFYTNSVPKFAAARLNRYIAGNTGTFKLEFLTTTAAVRAGLVRPAIVGTVAASNAGAGVPDNTVYAYRAVIRREDGNGLIVRSPPSISYPEAQAVSGSTGWKPKPVVFLASDVIAGDVIELYRTKSVSGSDLSTVGAEFFLAQTHELTSAEVTAGSYTFVDDTLDDNLGAPLYTNGTQEGDAMGNDPPPAAADVWWSGDVMWWGDCRDQEHMSLALINADRDNDGLQHTSEAGDITSGSAVITNMVNTADIHVGMAIGTTADEPDNCGTYWTGHSEGQLYVISKTATSVTMSRNAAATGAAVTVYFFDVLKIGLDNQAYFYATGAAGASPLGRKRFILAASDERTTANRIAIQMDGVIDTTRLIAHSFGADAFSIRPGQLLIEEDGVALTNSLSGDVILAKSSAPLAWDPVLPGMLETDVPWEKGWRRNALRYSKPLEPEHAPAVNVTYVGSSNDAVMRGLRVGDVDVIFTEKGIYRRSGSYPAFRLDAIDNRQIRLLHRDACCVLRGKAYAWTTHGVIATDGYQITEINVPVVGVGYDSEELRVVAQQRYERGFIVRGCFMVACEERRLVILGVPSSDSGDDKAERLWVYCERTDAWTRWNLQPRAACVTATGNLILDGGAAFWRITQDRGEATTDFVDEYDVATYVSISGDGLTVTIDSDDIEFLPAVGDYVAGASGTLGVVTLVTSSVGEWGLRYVLTVDSAIDGQGGTVTVYRAFECAVAWPPITMPTGYLWREATLTMRELDSDLITTPTCYFGGRTERSTLYETTISMTPPTDAARSKLIRMGPSRQIMRAAQLEPRFRIKQPQVRWSLQGVKLELEPTSERVAR